MLTPIPAVFAAKSVYTVVMSHLVITVPTQTDKRLSALSCAITGKIFGLCEAEVTQ